MTEQIGQRLDANFRKDATVKIKAMARYAYADAMLAARGDTNEDNK